MLKEEAMKPNPCRDAELHFITDVLCLDGASNYSLHSQKIVLFQNLKISKLIVLVEPTHPLPLGPNAH